jgi:uncharacterized spore protein YtfJ
MKQTRIVQGLYCPAQGQAMPKRQTGGAMTDSSALEKLGAIKDAMTVSRAFGESYQVNGLTIIPVATVRGGGGGGTGTGTDKESGEKGTGSGLGFGAAVRPVGVVVIKDGKVTWQPTIDVMRIILGAQLLSMAAIFAFRGRIKRREET